MDPTEIYFILLVTGIFLFISEVIVPGGAMGTVGFIVLLIASIMGFYAYGPIGGFISLIAIVTISILSLVIWLRVLPRTFIGRALTLERDGRDFKALDSDLSLLEKTGETITDLRPAGIIKVDNKRFDVVSESGWIESGHEVKIIKVEGARIVVRKVS